MVKIQRGRNSLKLTFGFTLEYIITHPQVAGIDQFLGRCSRSSYCGGSSQLAFRVCTNKSYTTWFHVKEDTMMSVYWTLLRHSLTLRAWCATGRQNTIWAAHCNGDEVYHLRILWQKIPSNHLYPWMNHANYREIAFEFGSRMHTPPNSSGL